MPLKSEPEEDLLEDRVEYDVITIKGSLTSVIKQGQMPTRRGGSFCHIYIHEEACILALNL